MSPQEIATELLSLREESSRIEAREEQLRDKMENLLATTPGNRITVGNHDFVLVPPGKSSQLSEDLLREGLSSHGLSETEVEEVLQAATKTSDRERYLRISGKQK